MDRCVHWRRTEGRATFARGPERSFGLWLLVGALRVLWQIVRIACCAALVLIEPVLRVTLVPVAHLSFLVTLIFGFVIGDPRFPRWGMLGFSVGALLIYWLFLGVMNLFMALPPDARR